MATLVRTQPSALSGLKSTPVHGTGRRPALEAPEESALAGRMTGLLYLTGAVSAVLILLLPGAGSKYTLGVLAVAGLGATWGVLALTLVPWQTAKPWVTHASTACGFGIAALLMSMTGGEGSPARFYLFFIVVYAAYFYPVREAVPYFVGAAVVLCLPFLYDHGAAQFSFYGEVLVVVPTYFVLGYVIFAGKRRLVEMREHADRLAAEQGALRRVATAVARGLPRDEVYALVALEAGGLLDAGASGICRFEPDAEVLVVGSWSDGYASRYEPGTRFPVRGDTEELLRTGQAVLTDRYVPDSAPAQLGYGCGVLAPVRVSERLWGLLAAVRVEPHGLPADAEERLSAFADLLGTAIANTETRARLSRQASTDPLTGLANHRKFHERLRAEVQRAHRYQRPLSLAVIDVDNFKRVNDVSGHEAGDRVLADIARHLGSMGRSQDVLARIGGDEFAILLPETDRMQAFAALERERRMIASATFDVGRMTISAGICDLEAAPEADAMFRLADGALYWSKAHGRDVVWIYDPETVQELSAEERAQHLERSAALRGLRALARAIDAKDAMTRRHSERVAALASQLAGAAGWNTARAGRLHEAALVHDVGKIGVPDAVLTKPGRLTREEFEQVKLHAALSAQIVAEVLDDEQTAWVAAHHERPDGRGYPRGLTAQDISEGAALLAVADAWDVMTASRPYSTPKAPEAAMAECRELAGAQFFATAVDALAVVYEAGSLDALTTGLPA
jgi:diguanylate cyclase (GGDEF)-like protein